MEKALSPVSSLQSRLIWATRRNAPFQRPKLHYRAGVTVWHLEKGSVRITAPGFEGEFTAPRWLLLGSGWSSHLFEEATLLTSVSVRIQSYEGPVFRLPAALVINPGGFAKDAKILVRLFRQRFHLRNAADHVVFQLRMQAAVASWSLHLGEMTRRHHPDAFIDPPRHAGLRQAMIWLYENIDLQKVTEPDLAKSGGMSVSNFKRVFQRQFGFSLREYLRQRKVDGCVEALLHTDKSIKQIAIEQGFSDPANFVRWFRQHFNQAPGAYREALASTD